MSTLVFKSTQWTYFEGYQQSRSQPRPSGSKQSILLEAWPLLLLDGYAVAISRIGKEGWYPCDSDSSALSIENHELQLDKEAPTAVDSSQRNR
jgi:hypothetical protein